MQIQVHIDDKSFPVDISENLIDSAEDFLSKIDHDMDHGWQMSRTWVSSPNTLQRCQIVADRLLSAMHTNNRPMVLMACAYIVKRRADTKSVTINTQGDMTQTSFS